jgi:DNA-binding GntR family transcriptional regulator
MTNRSASARLQPTPARRGTLRKKAYDTLKANILNGYLQCGERLPEMRLIREFDIGRTPVREALNQLEREGLVVFRPNSGHSVATFDMETTCHLLVVREGLDALAAELSVELASDADLDRLQGVMREIEALDLAHTRTPETYAKELELGLKIHDVILDATGNGPLIEMTHRVYDQLRLALWLEVLWIDGWKDGIEEHREIVDAVVARDSRRAVDAARTHIRNIRKNMTTIRDVWEYRRRIGSERLPSNVTKV